MPEIITLESLAQTAINFSISAVILAGLTALFLQAIYDLKLRAWLQRGWVRDWSSKIFSLFQEDTKKDNATTEGAEKVSTTRKKQEETETSSVTVITAVLTDIFRQSEDEDSLFALRYQQFCGQLAVALQNELNRSGVTAKQRQALAVQLEKHVDDLQIYLSRRWRSNNYKLNFAASLVIILLLIWTDNQFRAPFGQTTWLLLFVGTAAGLLAPVVRNLLDRLAGAKS